MGVGLFWSNINLQVAHTYTSCKIRSSVYVYKSNANMAEETVSS